jgi:hypothetical protein
MMMQHRIFRTQGQQVNELAEHSYYLDMLNLQISLTQQGKTIFDLDSTEINNLVFLAENSKGTAGTQAKGILEYAYGYHYCNCLPVDDPAAWKSVATMPVVEVDNGLSIQAVPNPASTWVAFNYTLPVHVNEAVLHITDVRGRSITSFILSATQGQQVWDTRDIQKGVYLYTIKAGAMSKNGKLIVN